MANENPPPSSSSEAEALKFHEFQLHSQAQAEATLKLILVVSGGMLTLSVGAVLGNSPPNALTWGWGLLFYSIAASLALMFSMFTLTVQVDDSWRKNLEDRKDRSGVVRPWPRLRVLNRIIGVSVFLSCVAGIALMAHVAFGVAATLGSVSPTGKSNGTAPTSKMTSTPPR